MSRYIVCKMVISEVEKLKQGTGVGRALCDGCERLGVIILYM